MKVTFSKDGSIAFEVNTTADAVELARALQNGAIPSLAPAEKVAPAVVPFVSDDPELDFDEAAEIEDAIASLPRKARGKKVSFEEQKGRIAAKEMGMSYSHYIVWDFLVNQDHRKHGVTADMIVRHLKITRGAASQRMQKLVGKGYAVRVSQGRYKAAIAGS